MISTTSLCFSVEEFSDVCTGFIDGRYSIDGGLRAYIYQINLCLGLLQSLKDRDVSACIYFPVV